MLLDRFENLDIELILTRLGLVLLSLLVLWIARRILVRVILPRLKRIVQRSDTETDNTILDAIDMPLSLLMGAIAIGIVAEIIWETPPGFIGHIGQSLLITAVFAAAYKLVGLVTQSTHSLLSVANIRIDEKLLPFIRTALKIVVVALGVVAILQEWQFDVAGLIAGLGVSGLAVALAAEDTIANLFGFTTIVGDRPLTVGDYIVTPDVTGTVEHVGFRSTRVRQLDRALVTIPNSKLASSVVTNWARLDRRRLDMTIGVTYDTTSSQLRELLERLDALLRSREKVDPETIIVLFSGFGDSSLDVRLIAQILLGDWGDFNREQQEIMLQVMDIVEEMGLSFAFPSRSLYIEQMPRPTGADPMISAQAEQQS